MSITAIIAALSRLVDWLIGMADRRHEAELENEVRDDVAQDARIKDLQRASDIRDRTDDVLDRVRRADGDATEHGQYRD